MGCKLSGVCSSSTQVDSFSQSVLTVVTVVHSYAEVKLLPGVPMLLPQLSAGG